MTALKAIVAGLIAALAGGATPSVTGAFHYWQIAAAAVAGLTAFNGTYFAVNSTPAAPAHAAPPLPGT